jgi:hypothetical protein
MESKKIKKDYYNIINKIILFLLILPMLIEFIKLIIKKLI